VVVARLEDAEPGRLGRRDGDGTDGDVRPGLLVVAQHRPVVHEVELVAGEDEHVGVPVVQHVREPLPDGVGRALKPVQRAGRLLGGEHLHEPAREAVEPVRVGDVAVEARRVELCEHEDPLHPRVDAVREGDVDEPVLPGKRDGGL